MPEEHNESVEQHLVKEFVQTFYKELGYYPIVILNKNIETNNYKVLTLNELEKYFERHLPKIYGKTVTLGTKYRTRPLPELRFIFSFIARTMKYSLSQISNHLGKRDHTSIIYGLSTFKNLYETDERFKNKYHEIINDIKKDYESSTMDYLDKTQDQSQSNLFFGLLQGEDPTLY